MLKLFRRGTSRSLVAVLLIASVTTLCVYYANNGGPIEKVGDGRNGGGGGGGGMGGGGGDASAAGGDYGDREEGIPEEWGPAQETKPGWLESDSSSDPTICPRVPEAVADIDTVKQFANFEFQPYWMKSREYWDNSFEERYRVRKQKWSKLPLKVILVPHSHNDPGWLKTFEGYYHSTTKHILNYMAEKLTSMPNMTFIWSEVSFLAQWWDSVHPTKKKQVLKLLDQGRLEITTGGWVMVDEATSHVFAMVDQLIEGHQWLRNNLGVELKTGWAVDPFGHGSTVPYLLKAAGLSGGAVIQRIHYAWKQWLAKEESGDFIWRQNWDADGHTDFLVHNQPFDIYSIKHSCGPHPQVCLNFDFRRIPGEYTEFSIRAVPIDKKNVRQKAELLLEQYGRAGSLVPHNVVMMPLGDDFRYNYDVEWEQQYRNYVQLFDYINAHNTTYNAEFRFGTPADYFKLVKERLKLLDIDPKTLKGDFFVYSDIFTEGRPAYWSGYFTTRPFFKILSRELEHNLRSAEILYTLSLNYMKMLGISASVKILERDFEKLSRARQNLALFQHHDAITGTSKGFVMHDYALKLFESLQEASFVQSYSVQNLLLAFQSKKASSVSPSLRFVVPSAERETYERLAEDVLLAFSPKSTRRKVLVFNSLAQVRYDVIKLKISDPNVKVSDVTGKPVVSQISPYLNITDSDMSGSSVITSRFLYELVFIVEVPPLSLSVFVVESTTKAEAKGSISTLYCKRCSQEHIFPIKVIQPGDVQLENHHLKLLFDAATGFLKATTQKTTGKVTQSSIQFAAYNSAQFHSGAYLFMPDPSTNEIERDVLAEYTDKQRIVIVSGPIYSELVVVYGSFLQHRTRLYHSKSPLGHAIYVENIVDFDKPPKNRETELFMRIVSDISNGDTPEFYTDANGFSMQKRVKVDRIGIEGNYFPITTCAYIQDASRRLSILVNHAQGTAAWEPGWLEVMLDRRTLYDDARGMGEGVVDNKRTLMKFWVLLEDVTSPTHLTTPSLSSNYLSNSLLYPSNVFLLDTSNMDVETNLVFISKPFPCDVHLMNLRTLTDPVYGSQFPSNSALMILHRQGFTCSVASNIQLSKCNFRASTEKSALYADTNFTHLKLKSITQTSLTGMQQLSGELESFNQLNLSPMDILTVNLTFSL